MAYSIEPRNPFFSAIRSMSEYEIQPGNTVTFIAEVDLTAIEAMRAAAGKDQRPSYTSFVAKAVAASLAEFPYANRRVFRRPWSILGGARLQKFDTTDIAVAAERNVPGSESATFVDIMRNVNAMSLRDINDWLRALATCDIQSNTQWREFHTLVTRFPAWLAARLLRMPTWFPGMWQRYRGGAVLISSPAKYGVDGVVGAWPWPLGVSFGLVKERAIVRDGQVVPAVTFNLVLNFDRRVMAGAQSARFFKAIVDKLHDPQTLEAATPPA